MAQPMTTVYGMLREWYERWCPELTYGQRRWLAKLVCAVVDAGACTQPALAAALQRLGLSRAKGESAQVEIRRFLKDPGLTVAKAYAPVVRQTLACWPAPTLLLIIDQTHLKDRLIRLEAALAYHGRTLALSWAVYPATGIPAGESWQRLFACLLDEAALVLPPGRQVVVLLDRGFCSPQLWDALIARGGHPVLRAQRTVRLRTAVSGECALGELLGAGGGLVTLAGQVFKKGGWRSASVTAIRRDGQEEAWLLLSDLPADLERACEYAVRMHIEQSFRDDKRQGWQWEQSRIRAPERAARLLLILHLASLWCLSAGATAVASGQAARWVRPARPGWSLFRIGWTWLRQALVRPELVPLHHRLPHLPAWRTPLRSAPSPTPP